MTANAARLVRPTGSRLSVSGRALACALLVLAIALSACSRRQTEWELARAADTVESYERFLKSFPEGEFSAQAQARAGELREARDWKKAVADNTLAAYQQFVAQYPEGRMSDEARIRIESFTLAAAAPATAPEVAATGSGTSADASSASTGSGAPSASPPTPAASIPARAPSKPAATSDVSFPPRQVAAAGGGGYRIQLGAFTGGERQAMGEWRRLQRDYAALLDGLSPSVKLATTTSGHLYRLQAGTTNEARARDICARLQNEGQACVVVLP